MKKHLPEISVALASAAWGLFWIPLRAFEARGLTASWAVLAQFLAPLAVLLPFALLRLARRLPTGVGQYRTGILVGLAVTLYLESLLLTDVARSLILFYMMPTWATTLEILVLRRTLTAPRGVSLVLGLSGMAIILLDGGGLALSLNPGDVLALLAGILFAFGALGLRRAEGTRVFEQLFAFFLFSSLAALVFALLPLPANATPPAAERILALSPWLAVTAAFLIPVMAGIYWGSSRVDPGRLGILLQIEAVTGIVSAALFAGEAFGLRQGIGALLVVGAGLVEVLAKAEPRPAEAAGVPLVRPATPADYAGIRVIANEVHALHAEGDPTSYRMTDDILSEEDFREVLAKSRVLVLESGGRVTGYATFFIQELRGDRFLNDRSVLVVEAIAVLASEAGKGHGRRLFGELERVARDEGHDAVELSVSEFNTRAISFYRKSGMKPIRLRMRKSV